MSDDWSTATNNVITSMTVNKKIQIKLKTVTSEYIIFMNI